MRRLAIAIAVAVLWLGPALVAHAQEEVSQDTPQGTFSSPTRSVAGQPIFVRSITSCPTTAGAYQYVRVFIRSQTLPSVATVIDETYGDLRSDGSWEVTIKAPADMPDGVTKSYSLHAHCSEDSFDYANPPAAAPSSPDVLGYFRYFHRPLYVTGFGSADAGPAGAASEETDVDDESSTTTSSSTTSTTAPSPTTTLPTPTTLATAAVPVRDPAAEVTRIAEIRRELAALGVDDTAMTDREVLLSGVTAAQRQPAEEGIPLWAFALAAILAVGAVIAYGAKRSPIDQLDR